MKPACRSRGFMGLSAAPSHVGDAGVADLVRAEGSASAPWAVALPDARDLRDVADAMHGLCQMYGAHPSPVDLAIHRSDDRTLSDWLARAADAFHAERTYLTRIVAAAGPLPSTPGQAQSEAAIAAQRHALDVLARSDRAGCAIGAAVALVLDWSAVRPIVDSAATRLGIAPPAFALPRHEPLFAPDPRLDRARIFGARQLLTQQRGLWTLLEARAAARQA